MMKGNFCNSSVYPLSCTAFGVNNALEATVNKPILENLVTCKSSLETFCVHEGVPNLFSLDIVNVAEEFTIKAIDVKFNVTPSNKTSRENDVSLMCFVRHGAMPSVSLHDYSSNLNKVPLVINSPLIGRWYISIVPVNLTKTHDSNVRICYSVESQMLQCPLGKAGPNCTMDIYTLQVVFFARCVSASIFFLCCQCHLKNFLYNIMIMGSKLSLCDIPWTTKLHFKVTNLIGRISSIS